MGKKPIDRRIQKTRKALLEALIALILERGYDAITVQDIIDRANVGRATFYSHFECKEHLLLTSYSGFKKLIEQGISAQEASTLQPQINFLILYQHVADNIRLAKAILGKKTGDMFADHLNYILAGKVIEYFEKTGQKDEKMMPLIADAAAAAMVRLLICWIDEGMPFSADMMAEKSQKLLLNMLK